MNKHAPDLASPAVPVDGTAALAAPPAAVADAGLKEKPPAPGAAADVVWKNDVIDARVE
jgi:hypothetical protein